jgi:hypothetical protein
LGAVVTTGNGNSDKIKIGNVIAWSGFMGNFTGSFTIDEGGVLPVRWGEIDLSVVDGTYVSVKWSTYAELNNDYFTIEYSSDLEEWREAKRVNGVGNSSSVTEYSDVFQPTFKGHVYVRIRQTDYDGTDDLSKVECVNFYYDEKVRLLYYLDMNGVKHITQPVGLSVKVYSNGLTEKVFKVD